ncbi:hypothetical protein C8N24_0717 [Solirubrobacter pauli]|uniref:Uncharacterized protein n=1 Tax=Solirubrobacter pauli TaxID=166793 RepID=A0A660L7A8_9ACTN|nr:hypothetical protein [Solirubrobacter pauli]RKQ90902.1 hypothetical protein C8N24_0717 [Solirubrobacter pauli]
MTSADQLLSDFIDDWNAGRRPRVREYLARLPDEQDRAELADRIDSWLQVAPTPAFTDEARAAIHAHPSVQPLLEPARPSGSWATVLPRLRRRAALSPDELAAGLVDRLDLAPTDTPRAADYLQRLELEQLDPTRLSRRLLDALGGLLDVSTGWLTDLAAAAPRVVTPPPAAALLRSDQPGEHALRHDLELLSRAALTPAPTPADELDRLFTGGRDA